jgi:hypothetical protein
MKAFSSAFHLRFMHLERVSLRDENKSSSCRAATSVRSALFDAQSLQSQWRHAKAH